MDVLRLSAYFLSHVLHHIQSTLEAFSIGKGNLIVIIFDIALVNWFILISQLNVMNHIAATTGAVIWTIPLGRYCFQW